MITQTKSSRPILITPKVPYADEQRTRDLAVSTSSKGTNLAAILGITGRPEWSAAVVSGPSEKSSAWD